MGYIEKKEHQASWPGADTETLGFRGAGNTHGGCQKQLNCVNEWSRDRATKGWRKRSVFIPHTLAVDSPRAENSAIPGYSLATEFHQRPREGPDFQKSRQFHLMYRTLGPKRLTVG